MKVSAPFAHHVPMDLCANMKWRAKVYRRVIEDPSYAQVIREACAIDPIFYVNGFAWTYDPRCEPFSKLPFILYPSFQTRGLLEIIRAINSHDLFIEKSRDMGASWLCITAFEWAWHFRKMISLLMLSRVEDYVDKTDNPKALFQKIDFIHDNLPQWLMPHGFKRSEHRAKMHLFNPENRSVIDGESTTGQAGRGDRRSAILGDEFAAVEQGRAVLRATRDATKCRIFNSTPAGTGNAHYDIRQTSIKKLRFHWSEHPVKGRGLYTTDENGNLKILSPESYPVGYRPIIDGKLRSPWYDGECKRVVSAREIAQELDIDYLGSGHQFFSASAVQGAIRKYARPPVLIGDLEYDSITGESIRFRENPEGKISLWCLLDGNGNFSTDHKTVLGVDVSAGTGSSNSALCGYDVATNEKLLEYVNPYIRPEELAKQAVAIAAWLSRALIIWERNGPGRQFGSRVVDLRYGNIHLGRREESLSKKVSDIPGWASTKDGKKDLLSEYRAGVEKFACINRSKEALEETLEYIFNSAGGISHSRADDKEDPTGAKANHGDRVIADALAWKAMTQRKNVPKPEAPSIPVGSMAWRMKQRKLDKPQPGRQLLTSEGW